MPGIYWSLVDLPEYSAAKLHIIQVEGACVPKGNKITKQFLVSQFISKKYKTNNRHLQNNQKELRI